MHPRQGLVRAAPAGLLVLLSIGAGCLGSGSKAADRAAGALGAIEGTVSDDELLPLVAAHVTLLPANLTTTTDDLGLFRFDAVEPGAWTVEARADGRTAGSHDATVVASSVTHLQLILSKVEAHVARGSPVRFQSIFTCSTSAGDCYDVLADHGVYVPGSSPERHGFVTGVDAGATGVNVTLTWTPQTALAQRFFVEGYAGQLAGQPPLFHLEGTSPIEKRLVGPEFLGSRIVDRRLMTLVVGLAPDAPAPAGAGVDQEFSLEATIGYWGFEV